MSNINRKYKDFDSRKGYPATRGLFYECTRCGEVIAALPDDNVRCKCRNISIDIDYGRINVEDPSHVKLFSEE